MSVTKKREFPTTSQVRQLPLQMSMEIPPEWEDRNGHVNVQFYLTLYELGGWNVLDQMGFDDEWLSKHQVSIFDLEHHLHFLDEIRVGEKVSAYNRVVGFSEKRFHGIYFIVNDDHERLAGTVEYLASNVDMKIRRTAPFLPQLADGIDRLHRQHQQLSWPAPACGVMRA